MVSKKSHQPTHNVNKMQENFKKTTELFGVSLQKHELRYSLLLKHSSHKSLLKNKMDSEWSDAISLPAIVAAAFLQKKKEVPVVETADPSLQNIIQEVSEYVLGILKL